MDHDTQEKVALHRWAVIAEATSDRLSAVERGALVRQIASRLHTHPDGSARRYSRGTIDRWIGAEAAWLGIDGVHNQIVEQEGISYSYSGGHQAQNAWYENYPANAVAVPLTINPGDLVYLTRDLPIEPPLQLRLRGRDDRQVLQRHHLRSGRASFTLQASLAGTPDYVTPSCASGYNSVPMKHMWSNDPRATAWAGDWPWYSDDGNGTYIGRPRT